MIDHFISHCRAPLNRKRDQGCVPALLLEPHQIGRCHLSALTGNFQKPILRYLALDAGGQIYPAIADSMPFSKVKQRVFSLLDADRGAVSRKVPIRPLRAL